MSLIKDLIDRARSRQGGATATAVPGQETLLEAVVGMIGAGGLNNFLEQFRRQGLGDQVQSWVGTGQNQPISPDQVQDAMGEHKIDTIARQSGLPKDETTKGLAQILPDLVDHLTPNGKLPALSNLSGMLGDLLANLHGGAKP